MLWRFPTVSYFRKLVYISWWIEDLNCNVSQLEPVVPDPKFLLYRVRIWKSWAWRGLVASIERWSTILPLRFYKPRWLDTGFRPLSFGLKSFCSLLQVLVASTYRIWVHILTWIYRDLCSQSVWSTLSIRSKILTCLMLIPNISSDILFSRITIWN